MKSLRASVSHIRCHPDIPYLFVAVSEGFIQVWNYAALSSSSKGHSSSAPEDDRSDDGDVSVSSADGGGPSAAGNRESNKDSGPCTCTAVFLHPENVEDPYSLKKKTYSITSISASSHFFSVVWDDTTTFVFNCSLSAVVPMKGKAIRCCSPVGQFTAPANAVLGAVAAHNTVPVLCQLCLVRGDGVGATVYLLALHLGYHDLAIADFSRINDGVDFDNIYISPTSGNILLTIARERQSNCTARLFRFSQSWLHSTGYCSPLMTRIHSNTRTFIEGDLPSAGSSSKSWPFSLSLHPLYECREELSVPLDVSYTICSMNRPGDTTGPFTSISLLAALTSSSQVSSWSNIPLELRGPVTAKFSPNNLKLNHNFIVSNSVPISDNFHPWEAVIIGNASSRRSVDWESDGIQSQLHSEGTLCLMQCVSNTGPISMYIKATDAAFWSGFVASVPRKTSIDSNSAGLLFISSQSNKIYWIVSKFAKVDDSRLNSEANYSNDLSVSMSRIWTASPGSPNVVIAQVSGTDNGWKEYLLATEPGRLDFDILSSRKLSLLPGEAVLDLLWEPSCSFTVACEDSCSSPSSYQNAHIGILTNTRVLITTASLQIISANNFSSPLKSKFLDAVTSISWIGSALIYSTLSGHIKYLLPPRKLDVDSALKYTTFLNLIRSTGDVLNLSPYTTRNEQNHDILCTLSAIYSKYMSLRIICCLPDRIIFSYMSSSSEYFSYLSVFSRPCNPVEPLLRGLLSKHACFGTHICQYPAIGDIDPIRSIDDCVKRISICYFGTNSDSASSLSPDSGVTPSSHISSKLSTVVFLSKVPEAASSLGGGTPSASNFNFSNFPRSRWIPSGLKFILAANNGGVREACIDILSHNPGLYEIFKGEEASSTSTLIRRDSLQSEQVLSAACLLVALGSKDEAFRLIDMIGHDILLAFALASYDTREGQMLSTFLSSITDKNFYLQESISPSASTALYPQRVQLRSLANFVRRFGVIRNKQASTDNPVHGGVSSPFYPEAIEMARKAHMLKRRGGLGPLSSLEVLSMDSLEDWIGKIKLDTISSDSSTASKIRFGSQISSRKESSPSEKMNVKDRPHSWIEDVGVGNERDKVVGYWRFSDSLQPNDPDFISSSNLDYTGRPPPPALSNFIDLSKFCTVLELVADKDSDLEPILPVVVEPSTSPVDPGEDPDKVKTVNDLVFPLQDEGFRSPAIRSGLRSIVNRGSPLDIGVYHSDEERRKMTLEVMVNRLEDPSNKKSAQAGVRLFKQYFAVRSLGQPVGYNC